MLEREAVMHLSPRPTSKTLPTRFPVGATYVVEGYDGENGQLRVFSRYVVLPGGQRIDIADDFGTSITRRRTPAVLAAGVPLWEAASQSLLK